MFRRRLNSAALVGPDGATVIVQRTSRKKTVGIIIENGAIRIRAPRRLTNWRIQELIDSRSAWIRDKLQRQATRPPETPCRYVDNEPIVYLGETYRLRLVPSLDATIRIEDDAVIAPQVADQRQFMASWYYAQAKAVLGEAAVTLAAHMGVAPRSISTREYRSQWGSCNANGDIRLNARLIVAPREVLEYVVVHELAHLIHLNHSAQFWAAVSAEIPDHRDRRKWLRENGASLQI